MWIQQIIVIILYLFVQHDSDLFLVLTDLIKYVTVQQTVVFFLFNRRPSHLYSFWIGGKIVYGRTWLGGHTNLIDMEMWHLDAVQTSDEDD